MTLMNKLASELMCWSDLVRPMELTIIAVCSRAKILCCK